MAKDYGNDSIRTMSSLEHFRAKSSMYGFQVGTVNGLYLMLKEIVDNSTDEAMVMDRSKNYPVEITFFVSKDKSTYQCLIQDFGRGIPVDKLVDCLTKANTSGKYDLDSYGGASTGTNGVGSKVVAALSKKFVAFTKRMDGFAALDMIQGELKNNFKTKKRIDSDKETVGTTILFQPDPDIMQAIPQMFSKDEPNGFTQWLSYMEDYSIFHRNSLIRIGVVDGLLKPGDLDISTDAVKVWKYLTNLSNFKRELKFESDLSVTPREYIIRRFGLKEPIWEPGVVLHRDNDPRNINDRLGYDLDIFIDDRTLKNEGGLMGAVNNTPINDQNSVHFQMLQNALKIFMEGYVLDSEEQLYFKTKYQIPLSGIVSTYWTGASFDGQDKSKFSDNVFGDQYRSSLRKQLKDVTEATWDRLWELIEENFKQAYAKYSHSQYKIKSNIRGLGYELRRAGSYCACESNDPNLIELFITEGDSAAGRVKTERDAQYQAYFKLNGKPINAVRANAKALLKNDIYQDLMELIGVRPTDKDLSNMRFSKILILTDADADGYHIAALLIGIFKEINPLILEEGRVYLTNPPLYSLRIQGQKRPLYLRDNAALMDLRSDLYSYVLDIYMKLGNAKEVKLEGKNYEALVWAVDKIGEMVTAAANRLNIEPFVLEQLMHCVDYLDERNVNTEAIRKTLKVDNVIWDKDTNSIVLVIQGLDKTISLSHLQNTIIDELIPLYDEYNWDELNLFVTSRFTDMYVHTPCSFIFLYTLFMGISDHQNSKNFKITRFKGLGEMAPEDISGTCIDPITRCVTRISGIGDVDKIYAMLGQDSESRKELVLRNSVRGKLETMGLMDKDL